MLGGVEALDRSAAPFGGLDAASARPCVVSAIADGCSVGLRPRVRPEDHPESSRCRALKVGRKGSSRSGFRAECSNAKHQTYHCTECSQPFDPDQRPKTRQVTCARATCRSSRHAERCDLGASVSNLGITSSHYEDYVLRFVRKIRGTSRGGGGYGGSARYERRWRGPWWPRSPSWPYGFLINHLAWR